LKHKYYPEHAVVNIAIQNERKTMKLIKLAFLLMSIVTLVMTTGCVWFHAG